MEYLPDLLRSVFAQTCQDFVVRIIDNASNDGVAEFIRENYPQVTLIRNTRNLGFGAAHNQGIRYAIDKWPREELGSCYVLVTNPDAILTPGFLETLLREADARSGDGSFGGKLLRAFGENLSDDALKDTVHSELIDSTGLRATKSRWFSERGAGELDEGQYDQDRDVFGASGALCLYRASALEDTRLGDEFFDPDFFAYKEDIDLAWRLQERGWASRYVPEAVAYHYRGMYGKERMGFIERMKNRRSKSRRRSFYSTRNHWGMLFKNVSFAEFLLNAPWIASAEAARVFYVFLLEWTTLPAIFEMIRWLPLMWRKRRFVLKHRTVGRRELGKWFGGSK